MVVRIEAVVGELDRDEHSLPAVVDEAGVVRAIVDRMVVRVDNVQIQLVLGSRTSERHHERVRAIGVFTVVNVHSVARLAAVADHVHLVDTDDVGLRSGALIAVLVAAPQPLLLAREVDEAHGVRHGMVLQSASDFHHADGAGGIVIRAGSTLLVLPRAADRRVEVTAHDDDLLGVDRAGNLGFDVVQRLAAHLVGDALDGDAERLVVVLDVLKRELQIAVVGVARSDLHGLAANRRLHFTRQDVQMLGDAGDGDRLMRCLDSLVARGQVADVDVRLRLEQRTLHFVRVELAAAASVLAVVNSMELAVVGRFAVVVVVPVVMTGVLVVTVIVRTAAAVVRLGGVGARSRGGVGGGAQRSPNEQERNDSQSQNEKNHRDTHVRSPLAEHLGP